MIHLIDWERRKAEDVEIAADLAGLPKSKVGYQNDAGASYTYAQTLQIVLFNCGDGKVRGTSTVAMLRSEFCLHEGMTLMGTQLGGKEDVPPLGAGNLTEAAQLIALFAGGPAATVLGAIGGSPGSKPIAQFTLGELLAAIGVHK